MIFFRQADRRYPFFWESREQPPARWHGADEGPVQYLADTPNGAWAEFLRHEEISDPVDLAGISRAVWAVEVHEPPTATSTLPLAVLQGGIATYAACREEARRLRAAGVHGLAAPSAALLPGQAAGWLTDGGLRRADPKEGGVAVLFGGRPEVAAWAVAHDARPPVEVLDRVRHL